MGGQAFDAPRLQAFYLDPDEDVTILCLDTDDGPECALYDPRYKIPVDSFDIANVLAHGILIPGIVRKEKMAGDLERTVVIDGRQRTRWARAANAALRENYSGKQYDEKKVRVPFYVVKNADEEKLARIIIAANHRKESSILVKAEQAQQRISRGHALKDIAVDFAVSPQAVEQWVRCLGLSEKMRKAVEAGLIAPYVAIQYDDLPNEEQDRHLADAERFGVKLTSDAARTARSARKRGSRNGHTVRRRVGAGTLRKLVGHEAFMDALEPSEQALLKWICGEPNQDRRVKGLRSALKEIGFLGKDED